MVELQEEAKHHLNKTTNTIILDYLLWLASKTILDEAASINDGSSSTSHRSKGRRLVGLVDGLILTFDLTDRPKFSYTLLTRRIDLASLVIVFIYRDSRSQYITRRSSETQSLSTRANVVRARSTRFLTDRGIECVIRDPPTRKHLQCLRVSPDITSRARRLFEIDESGETKGRISLRDALHRFFLVSASGYTTHTPGPLWISIALNFCLFAALESYLVLGETGEDCVNECFHYGSQTRPEYGQAELDRLFTNTTNTDFSARWEDFRQGTLDKFLIPSTKQQEERGTNMDAHLLRVLEESDFSAFWESVTTYLGAVLESMDDPELCKYPSSSALDRSILRAPGMISIAHESTAITPSTTTTTTPTTTTNGSSQVGRKRLKVAS